MPTQRPRRADRRVRYETAAYLALATRVARNLRSLREAKGWTQEQAGGACDGMAMQQYQRIESGQVNLTFTTLARLAEGFRIDPKELLAPSEGDSASDPPPPKPSE